MEILNNYSGLISLIAAIAAIGAIIVPFVILKKQRKYEAEKEELAKKEMAEMERKDAQAELDAIGVIPFGAPGFTRMDLARVNYLKKKAGRRNSQPDPKLLCPSLLPLLPASSPSPASAPGPAISCPGAYGPLS